MCILRVKIHFSLKCNYKIYQILHNIDPNLAPNRAKLKIENGLRSLLKPIADRIFMSLLRYGLPVYCPLRLKEEDPKCQSIDRIKVVFNDCLRLLTNKKRKDHARVEDMLKELGWLSLNQLCAETRLLEAWKSVHIENYCMQDLLHEKSKSNRGLRSDEQTLFEPKTEDKFANGSFLQKTTQI